jgi:hypothetical protein
MLSGQTTGGSMTDRELLEKAAKAAGFETAEFQNWPGMDVRYGFTEAIWNGEQYWNPLTEDGDALRLAVKLNLIVEIGADFIYAFRTDVGSEEHATSDPYAATRRAIVRAAAAIEGGY